MSDVSADSTIDPSKVNTLMWAVVPAAGIGARVGASFPKQYLTLHGKTILEHTLERLLQLNAIAGIVVAIAAKDDFFSQLAISKNPRIHTVIGGQERSNSVLNALHFLKDKVDQQSWVLVHDAARPCVSLASIQKLINAISDHAVGGILGIPVSDTLKQVVRSQHILTTQDRSALWQAQTPQIFRLALLHSALIQGLANSYSITDESSAIEMLGLQPLIVEGRADNIKITRPEDVALAEFILQQQAH